MAETLEASWRCRVVVEQQQHQHLMLNSEQYLHNVEHQQFMLKSFRKEGDTNIN